MENTVAFLKESFSKDFSTLERFVLPLVSEYKKLEYKSEPTYKFKFKPINNIAVATKPKNQTKSSAAAKPTKVGKTHKETGVSYQESLPKKFRPPPKAEKSEKETKVAKPKNKGKKVVQSKIRSFWNFRTKIFINFKNYFSISLAYFPTPNCSIFGYLI